MIGLGDKGRTGSLNLMVVLGAIMVFRTWVGCEWRFRWLNLAEGGGGLSCPSNWVGVCVGGSSCASDLVCVWGLILVPHTRCVCAGLFLSLCPAKRASSWLFASLLVEMCVTSVACCYGFVYGRARDVLHH